MQVLTSSGEESDYTVVLQVDTTTGETTGFLQSNGIVYNVMQGPGNSPLRVVQADSFTPPPRNMNMPDALPVPTDRNLRGNNNNNNDQGLYDHSEETMHRQLQNQGAYSYEVEVFFEIDQQFINNSPGSANNLAEGLAYLDVLLSGLNLVYEKEIDTHISIQGVEVTTRYNAASDTGQALDLLKQARDYGDWPQGADLVHAVLGRGLGGGIAYLGTICNTGFGFGVSAGLAGQYQGGYSVVWDIVVLAHELGHNFDSEHAHDASFDPPVDSCYSDASQSFTCPSTNYGTGWASIMSYCHICAGGITNVRLTFGGYFDEAQGVWVNDEQLIAKGFSVSPKRIPTIMNNFVSGRSCVAVNPVTNASPAPSVQASSAPSPGPTNQASSAPSTGPSPAPSPGPSGAASNMPSIGVSNAPSPGPTDQASDMPSPGPSLQASNAPSPQPSPFPSPSPSETASNMPSPAPFPAPTGFPTDAPVAFSCSTYNNNKWTCNSFPQCSYDNKGKNCAPTGMGGGCSSYTGKNSCSANACTWSNSGKFCF